MVIRLPTWTLYCTTWPHTAFCFLWQMNQRQREISLTFTTRCPHACMLWQCLVVLPSLCSWSSVSCDELDRGLKHKGACTISWWSVHLNNNRGRIVSVQEAHCCYGGEERGAWDLEYFLLWSGMQGRHCASFFWSVTAHEVMTVKPIHVFTAIM